MVLFCGDASSTFATLERERTGIQRRLKKQIDETLESASVVDGMTRGYFEKVLAGSPGNALNSFKTLYEHLKPRPTKSQCMRMVVLSDATGSMNKLWGNARQTITTIVTRMKELTEEYARKHQLSSVDFQFQWIAYKDYSDTPVLQKSGWTSDANLLQQFINRIQCEGGGGDGPEAVEHALQEARQDHESTPISRVILIGDAPPHPEKAGEKLPSHNHILKTDYMEEARKLKALDVPVFCFRVGDWVRAWDTFKEIATVTGGEVEDLDPEKLQRRICESGLEEIGGSELVAEYRARYRD